MAPRKRLSGDTAAAETTTVKENPAPEKPKDPSFTSESPISPPKWGLILKLSFFLIVPYFYLIFFHYHIESDLKRSILINAFMCVVAFFVTVRMIPVASRYVLRRNLFGYDINKKGTDQGTVKV